MLSLGKKLYTYIAIILSTAVLGTLLTPIPAMAATSDLSKAGQYVGSRNLTGTAATVNTFTVWHDSAVAQACSIAMGSSIERGMPWALLTNKGTGQQYWGNSYSGTTPDANGVIQSSQVSFSAGIRYPGATINVRLYDRDPSKCTTPPDILTATPRITSEDVVITWEKPEIFNAYFIDNSRVNVETNVPQNQAFKPPNITGLSFFTIRNYGQSNQSVIPIDTKKWPCNFLTSTSQTCTLYPPPLTQLDAIGAATIPNYLTTTSTTYAWPPAGAISSKVASRAEIGGPADIPDMTKGGIMESAPCLRLCSADPIDNYSGNFFERDTDLSIPGRIGINVDRHYSVGNLGTSGAFGNGWTLGYDMKVQSTSDLAQASLIEPSGNVTPFSLDAGSNQYKPASPVIRASLKRTGAGWEFNRWNELQTYVFSTDGNLQKIVDNNANEVTLERDPTTGHIVKVTEGARWVALAWNGDRLISATDHSGREVSYTYDSSYRLTSFTDAEQNVNSYTYDSSDRVLTMTNAAGGVTTNTYDDSGRVSQQLTTSGRPIVMSYGVPSYTGEVTNTETSGTAVKTFKYIKGRISSVSDSADRTKDAWYIYDSKGRLVSTTYADERVHKVLLSYDEKSNVIRSEDTVSKSVETAQWTADGQMKSRKDAAGLTTENTFDERGNVVSKKAIPAFGNQVRLTDYEVSSVGDITKITNPLGGETTMEYSPVGDFIASTTPVGDKTTYEHNLLGWVTKKTTPGGNVPNITEEERSKFTEITEYDQTGKALTVVTRSGATSYSYDSIGRPVSIIDPRGKVKEAAYDAEGRVTSISYPDDSSDIFSYDSSTGVRDTWTDSKGRVTEYSQNGFARSTKTPNGEVSALTTTIDWNVNQVKKSLTDSSVTNQQLSVASPTGGIVSTGTRNDSYTVDTSGRTTSETTDNGTSAYSYDGFGNLLAQTSTVAGRNISYLYDVAGNITRITYPDGTYVSRDFDSSGRVFQITDWHGITYTFEYSSSGGIKKVVSSTGLRYEQEYDGTRPVKKEWLDAVDQVMASFDQEYDSSGLVSSDTKDTSGSPSSRTFAWGDSGNLTKVNAQNIGWDGKYLTSNESFSSINYDAVTGRLATAIKPDSSTVSFAYDSRGNRTSMNDGVTTTNYAWDVLGRMTGSGADTYSYGIDGMRTKVNNAQQVYGTDMKILSDDINKFLWSVDGTLLAQEPLNSNSSVAPYQAITDSKGSVYALVQLELVQQTTDQYHFNVVSEYSYSVFGSRSLVSGVDATQIGFVSEQHDASGLIYLRARYYDPSVGQFISMDPLVSDTLDPYGYASGNPLMLIDPLGLFSAGDTSTVLAVASIALTVLAVVATGPVGLIIATATLISIASTALGAAQTFQDCNANGLDTNCQYGIAATMLSAVPFVGNFSRLGAFSRPIKNLGLTATSPAKPIGRLGTVASSIYRDRKATAGIGFVALNSAGLTTDILNRVRIEGEKWKPC